MALSLSVFIFTPSKTICVIGPRPFSTLILLSFNVPFKTYMPPDVITISSPDSLTLSSPPLGIITPSKSMVSAATSSYPSSKSRASN